MAQACGAIALIVSLVACLGCEQVAPPPPVRPKLSPEQKLEVLVGRLQDLTKDTNSDIGLRVKREISHRFLPAKVSAQDSEELEMRVPRAEINVVTKRFISFYSGENPITGEVPEESERQPMLHRSDTETKRYDLQFQDNRWQLETELTDESEKIWFKHALEAPN